MFQRAVQEGPSNHLRIASVAHPFWRAPTPALSQKRTEILNRGTLHGETFGRASPLALRPLLPAIQFDISSAPSPRAAPARNQSACQSAAGKEFRSLPTSWDTC